MKKCNIPMEKLLFPSFREKSQFSPGSTETVRIHSEFTPYISLMCVVFNWHSSLEVRLCGEILMPNVMLVARHWRSFRFQHCRYLLKLFKQCSCYNIAGTALSVDLCLTIMLCITMIAYHVGSWIGR